MIKVRCPICDRVLHGQSAAERPQFPFCSERCRLIDLGRWLGENYRIQPPTGGEASPSPAGFDDDRETP
jgi:endogenous inhibitor of DNA gyrase (YacG/DUF329 family)